MTCISHVRHADRRWSLCISVHLCMQQPLGPKRRLRTLVWRGQHDREIEHWMASRPLKTWELSDEYQRLEWFQRTRLNQSACLRYRDERQDLSQGPGSQLTINPSEMYTDSLLNTRVGKRRLIRFRMRRPVARARSRSAEPCGGRYLNCPDANLINSTIDFERHRWQINQQ